MDRTIASVAVWPVFIVHLKKKDLILFRLTVDVARTLLLCSVCCCKRSYSFCCCADKETKSYSSKWKKQNTNNGATSHPVWLLLEFVWHSFYLLDFFSLVYNVHEMRGGGVKAVYGIPLVVRWSVEEKKKTGCMMSMFAIPTPLALRIALQPQFSVFYFSFFFPHCLSLSWSSHESFCMWMKKTKKHLPL